MNDGVALYKNVCTNPDDDTLRLIYADYLDEQGEHIRAEYIRLSVSMQFPPDDAKFTSVAEWDERYMKCKRMMLEHGRGWIDTKCRICGGNGNCEDAILMACKGCFGLGNLYDMRNRFRVNVPRKVEYERGFPVSVTCNIEEVFPAWNNVPHQIIDIPIDTSEWCKQIVETTPITRFLIENLMTYRIPSGRKQFKYQWRDYTGNTTIMTGVLPVWLFELVTETSRQTTYTGRILEYSSFQEAHTALGMAIGKEVRRQVYGNVVTT